MAPVCVVVGWCVKRVGGGEIELVAPIWAKEGKYMAGLACHSQSTSLAPEQRLSLRVMSCAISDECKACGTVWEAWLGLSSGVLEEPLDIFDDRGTCLFFPRVFVVPWTVGRTSISS